MLIWKFLPAVNTDINDVLCVVSATVRGENLLFKISNCTKTGIIRDIRL